MKHSRLRRTALKLLFILCICSAALGISACRAVGYGVASCIAYEYEKLSNTIDYKLNEECTAYSVSRVGQSITDVVIPSEYKGLPVTGILKNAFLGPEGIYSSPYVTHRASLVLPASIAKIEEGAFSTDSQFCMITKVYYAGNLEQFTSIDCNDAMLYNCKEFYLGGEKVESLVFPETVKYIPNHLFHGYEGLTSLKLGAHMEEIGAYAFANCGNLTTVELPEGLEAGEGAFSDCTNLNVASINCEKVPAYAFSGCTQLFTVKLGEAVTSIEANAFNGCNNLVEVYNLSALSLEIGSSDNGAIAECARIIHNSLSEPSRVDIAEDFTFFLGDDGDELFVSSFSGDELVLPERERKYKVAKNLFKGKNFKSVQISASVTELGDYAFASCHSLKTLEFDEGIAKIGDYTFAYCYALKNFTFPNSLQSIGNCAYKGCDKLTQAVIPDGVKTLGNNIFADCNVTSVKIGFGLETYDNSFSDCKGLTSIEVSPDNKTFSGDGNCIFNKITGELLLACASTQLPNGIKTVRLNAYVSMPDEFIVPNGAEKIKSSFDCSALKTIQLPASLIEIDSVAFRDCKNLERIYVDSENSNYSSEGNCLIDLTAHKLILGCKNSVIPRNAELTSIGDYAFSCSGIKKLEIPEGVKQIGRNAFCESAIESVSLPASLEEIGYRAFSETAELTGLKLPRALVRIESYAFYKSAISSLQMPESLEYLGDSAFKDCTNLVIVTVPGGIERVAKSTFDGCTSLRTVHLGEGITTISYYAFSGCHALRNLILPSTLTSVDSTAFDFYTDSEGNRFTRTIRVDFEGTMQEWMQCAGSRYNLFGSVVCADGIIYYESEI